MQMKLKDVKNIIDNSSSNDLNILAQHYSKLIINTIGLEQRRFKCLYNYTMRAMKNEL